MKNTISTEIIKSKAFKIIVSLLGLIISYKLTEIYLVRNFDFFGESYRKGLGFILTENFTKGSFFIFTRELLTSLFFSSVIYFLIQNNIRTIFKKIVAPILVLILLAVTIFVGIKSYDIYAWNYDRKIELLKFL